MRRGGLSLLAAVLLSIPGRVSAQEPLTLTLSDHQFTPNSVAVAAHKRFSIQVINQDDSPAEFESSDLKIEKIVVPKGQITVTVGPLKPGTYKFFDDYHDDTATGTITASDDQGVAH